MARRSAAAAVAPVLPDAPAEAPPPALDPDAFRIVPLREIVESPLNPRKRFPQGELEDLARSIRRVGLLEPLVVRPYAPLDRHGSEAALQFEIVAGARRFRAATLAGLYEVPVTVRVVTDEELLTLALEENGRRGGISPLEEARAHEQLRQLDGIYRDDAVLAAKIGRSETYVRDRRKLLTLAPVVQEALEAEAIPAKLAERLARLPADQHARALAACFDPLLVDGKIDARTSTTLAGLLERRAWANVAPAVVSLRKFDAWVELHGKVDAAAPEVQQQLLEAGALDGLDLEGETTNAEIERALTSLLQLSLTATTNEARALNVLPPPAYRVVVKAKDRCEHTRKGVVVHPPPDAGEKVELLDVCAERRRCRKHWPAADPAHKPAKKSADDIAREQAAREQAEATRQAWAAMRPTALRALGTRLASQRLSALVVARLGMHEGRRHEIREKFGIALTDRTALVYLLLNAAGWSTYDAEDFYKSARRLGVARKPLDAEIARQAKTAPAATKAATKKGGKKR